jgi:hypothetical protein
LRVDNLKDPDFVVKLRGRGEEEAQEALVKW